MGFCVCQVCLSLLIIACGVAPFANTPLAFFAVILSLAFFIFTLYVATQIYGENAVVEFCMALLSLGCSAGILLKTWQFEFGGAPMFLLFGILTFGLLLNLWYVATQICGKSAYLPFKIFYDVYSTSGLLQLDISFKKGVLTEEQRESRQRVLEASLAWLKKLSAFSYFFRVLHLLALAVFCFLVALRQIRSPQLVFYSYYGVACVAFCSQILFLN